MDARDSESEVEEQNELLNGGKARRHRRESITPMEMSEYNWEKTETSFSGPLKKKFVFTVPGVMKQHSPREYKLKTIVVFLLFLIVIYISLTYVFHKQHELHLLQTEIAEGIHFDERSKILRILNPVNRQEVLRGSLGTDLPDDLLPYDCATRDAGNMRCFKWKKAARLEISQLATADNGSTRCYNAVWKSVAPRSTLCDCFGMSGAAWFGVGDFATNSWPLNTSLSNSFVPFVTGEGKMTYGAIIDRYWLSSKGVALSVDWSVPLFVKMWDGTMCLKAEWTRPYNTLETHEMLILNYTICLGPDLTRVHSYVSETLKWRPRDKPVLKSTISRLIWTTRVTDKTALMNYVDGILDFAHPNFDRSIVCIGSGWQKEEGDLIFDRNNFSDSAAMISALHNKGFDVALEVHPYISTSSINYLRHLDLWITDSSKSVAALTRFGHFPSVAVLDSSNDRSVNWFSAKLKYLGVDSFVLLGGQTSHLPVSYSLHTPTANPDFLLRSYIKAVSRIGDSIGTCASAGQQPDVGFVLLPPRSPNWSREDGLASLIPLVLSTGLAGFPLINPGTVGGNPATSDPQLFIRWLQISIFLPVVQLSLSPKNISIEAEKISRDLLAIRLRSVLPLLTHLTDDALRSGTPLIRPLWWAAPNDSTALMIDDEFLVGDDLLVAPVLSSGATFRDVYFPSGVWNVSFENRLISGPKWVYHFPAPLNRVLYFTRVPL